MAESLNALSAPSRRKRIVMIALCSAMAVAGLVALIFFQIKPISRPRELTLSDGTSVRIEAITFGKQHSYSTDPVREKLARRAPAPLRRFLARSISSTKMLTDPDALVIWITRQDRMSGYVFRQNEWHHTKDRHGCDFQSIYRASRSLGGRLVIGVVFDNFPRGEDTFDYVIADRDGKRLGRFTLTNPFKVAPKRWVPEHLPITKTNGELVVELRRLPRVYSANPQMPLIRRSKSFGPWSEVFGKSL